MCFSILFPLFALSARCCSHKEQKTKHKESIKSFQAKLKNLCSFKLSLSVPPTLKQKWKNVLALAAYKTTTAPCFDHK